MKKSLKELAKKAGFILWEDEDWKPKDEVIDWSSSYDKELEKFAKLVIQDYLKRMIKDTK
jgi:hypothetical protein